MSFEKQKEKFGAHIGDERTPKKTKELIEAIENTSNIEVAVSLFNNLRGKVETEVLVATKYNPNTGEVILASWKPKSFWGENDSLCVYAGNALFKKLNKLIGEEKAIICGDTVIVYNADSDNVVDCSYYEFKKALKLE